MCTTACGGISCSPKREREQSLLSHFMLRCNLFCNNYLSLFFFFFFIKKWFSCGYSKRLRRRKRTYKGSHEISIGTLPRFGVSVSNYRRNLNDYGLESIVPLCAHVPLPISITLFNGRSLFYSDKNNFRQHFSIHSRPQLFAA